MKPACESPPFIPDNPNKFTIIQDLFMDEDYADVVFEVGGNHERKFYAHKLVLSKASPELAELTNVISDGSLSLKKIEISDVQPDIFHHLLTYLYGHEVVYDSTVLSRTMDIMKAADKYGVTNLKLEAEAYYVTALTITTENVTEQLLIADSLNCAHLKEAVMDYIVKNCVELLTTKALEGAPDTLLKDTLTAVARSKGATNESSIASISELRRKCYERGLDFDGSREALMSALETLDVNDDKD